MPLMSSLRTNKEIKERKKILKNIRLLLDQYNTFMIEYMCKGKGGILPTKKELIKEINKMGKKKVDYFGLFRVVDDVTTLQRSELLAREYGGIDYSSSCYHGKTNEEIEAEIKRISNTWYLWASRYTGDVVEDFKTLVDICKDKKNSIGLCNVFEDDIECFDSFKKKYGIEPSYSIGKGDYHYDDKEDDAWSNLCYEFDTAVRPVLCLMWKYYHIVG